MFGDDFSFENALYNFYILDVAIELLNKDADFIGSNFRYSTPSEYLDAVMNANSNWTVRTNDMFPYNDEPKQQWTGFYTTRPNLKQIIRKLSQDYHASMQLYSKFLMRKNYYNVSADV